MTRTLRALALGLALTLAGEVMAQVSDSDFRAAAKHQIEQAFAAAVVLTDSEAVAFGFINFDPNEFVPLGDLVGDQQSVALRASIQTYTIPWQFSWAKADAPWRSELDLKASYLKIKQEVSPWGDQLTDRNRDQVLALATHYWLTRAKPKRWQVHLGAGAYLASYDNEFTYRNPATAVFAAAFDGTLFNLSAQALLLAPAAALTYTRVGTVFEWRYRSELEAFAGATISGPAAQPSAGQRRNHPVGDGETAQPCSRRFAPPAPTGGGRAR